MTRLEQGLSPRPDLAHIEPYISPQLPARYRLNTNESPYTPPPELVASIADAIRDIALNRYPDRDATSLYAKLAARVARDPSELWIANGSNEVFLHLSLTYGGGERKVMTFEPTYPLHTLIPTIAATACVGVERAPDLRIDVDVAVDAIRREDPDIVIVTSPNNPSGTLEPRATIEALLEAARGLVVVDEAYIEFAPDGSTLEGLLADAPNLAITRTFSKAWRLAGVRLGYLMASQSIISDMAKVRLPYSLSALTQVVGGLVLDHADDTASTIRKVVAERDRIGSELAARSLDPLPSAANFVMFSVDDAARTWQALYDRGVLIRSYPGVPALADKLRATAGLPDETDAFLEALDEVLGA